MYVGRDFSPFDSVESEVFTFDFTKRLGDAEAIIEATWFCTVADDSDGEDASASDHVSIPATFGDGKTSQHVSGLVAGVKYALQAVIGTDEGNVISLWSHVICRDPH